MMAGIRSQWSGLSLRSVGAICVCYLGVASMIFLAEARLKQEGSLDNESEEDESGFLMRVLNFLWQKGQLGYTHVWPEMKFGWQIVVGSIIGFFGAAFGSVGGVGGGGIFVPMLTLIIGFDAKSSTAISKCMITGAAASTVYYNLKLRHPTLDLPIIDYDLALLFQPVLVLGISVGVAFNVIFADWMITVLLIILFLGTSTKAFFKGVETWKKETIIKKEAARRLASNGDGSEEVEYKPLPGGPSNGARPESNESKREEVSVLENVQWKELGILFAVWLIILTLEITKNNTTTCSVAYWVCNLLQIPVALGVSSYQAVSLYKGRRKIASKGEAGTNWKVHQLVLYCCCGVLAGVVGAAWSWWRIHFGTTFSGVGSPSTGVKCHSYICHDIFCIYVCHRVLSLETFSSSLCSILCRCGNCRGLHRAARGKKDYQYTRESISNHLHSVIHNICECNITRWGWYSKHDSED
ncbi:hypothetical protein GH714_035357 [Hevea brasiliensis]|uniref:Sulfite exporter TauE/SafE family protein n=1 Tax=Hevea brasiliensis TaxID=3981 RepID=A0A6A6NDU0_HEVBR|nr:hypothetical protein GH714_035357 [Hevea brasiliensis]